MHSQFRGWFKLNIYLNNSEINLIVNCLEEYFDEHQYYEFCSDRNGIYHDERFPDAAKEATMIQDLYSKLLR